MYFFFSVYSHTFLCYGLTEAHHRHNFFLVNKTYNTEGNFGSGLLEEPCLPIGIQKTYSPHDYNVPCTLNTTEVHSNDTLVHQGEKGILKHFKKYKVFNNSHDVHNNYFLLENYVQNMIKVIDNEIIEKENETFNIVGTSNPKKCQKKIRMLFNENLCNKTFKYGNCLHKGMVPLFRKELVVS